MAELAFAPDMFGGRLIEKMLNLVSRVAIGVGAMRQTVKAACELAPD